MIAAEMRALPVEAEEGGFSITLMVTSPLREVDLLYGYNIAYLAFYAR